ncbi:MAG: NADH-quinone oxidoreductase subunit NuoG [Alphaproteobacteria bacterium]|nr:MAG: NADH-quinone oxidoreductase subunit NuoG [Alphaproteobacteria bacterium]
MRLTIDGRQVEAQEGEDLLTACTNAGVEVPHFCWHRAMGSIGACRLCAVKVRRHEADPGTIEMACMIPVADGQHIDIADPEAAAFRGHVIEWLMRNHPHDCAVCEEGGDCRLQDMTIASGHHLRRAGPDKRIHRNQYLGPLITHEMNRCIACYRCTRFYRGVAGGRDLDVFGAHDRVYFGRAEDGVLESPFAGNLAEICPTGVFNDRGWSKVYARPWDMLETPSVCPHCAVGCNIGLSVRANRLRRVISRSHPAINADFLCDRGRYGPLFIEGPSALKAARHHGHAVPLRTALDQAQEAIAVSAALGGAIGIGSPRASLEANYALRRLVGPEHFFAGLDAAEVALHRRLAAHLANASIASLADIAAADAILVLGEDLTGTAPMAALAVRQASRAAERALAAEKHVPAFLDNAVRVAGEGRRAPLVLVTPVPDALDAIATHPLRRAPADIAGFGHAIAAALAGKRADPDASAAAAALAAASAPVIIAGAGLGDPAVLDAAAAIATALNPRARLALFPAEANSLGLALLGGEGLEAAADVPGRGAVVVLENDLHSRCDPATIARLFADRAVIALDCVETATTAIAHTVVPVASFADAAGTCINHEGRAQRTIAARPDSAPAAWRVLAAFGGGAEAGLDDLQVALARDCPQFAAIAAAAPAASYRTPSGRIARAPARFSGRTASDSAGGDAAPPRDPDSPFSWTMEGGALPAELFQGVRILAAAALPPPAQAPAIGGAGLILIPLHDPFSVSETDRASTILAARAPGPQLRLHPADAARLKLAEGAIVSVEGRTVPLVLDKHIPIGHAGLTTRRTTPRRLMPEGSK